MHREMRTIGSSSSSGGGYDIGLLKNLKNLSVASRTRIRTGGQVMRRVSCGSEFILVGEGQSDDDLRDALREALRDEPGFLGVELVFPEDGHVIYATSDGETSAVLFRRSYTQDAQGGVTLGSEKDEVQAVTTYEPATSPAPPEPAAAAAADEVPPPPDMAERVRAAATAAREPKPEKSTLSKLRALLTPEPVGSNGVGEAAFPRVRAAEIGGEVPPPPDMIERVRAARKGQTWN